MWTPHGPQRSHRTTRRFRAFSRRLDPGPKPRGAQLTLEEDLRWDGIALLRQLGYRAYNLEQGYRPGPGHTRVGKGIPDVYFHGQGVRGWIEFKRWDNDQTPEQKEFERWELEAGGVYLLVYEVEQIVSWHERGGQGTSHEIRARRGRA